MASRLLRNKFVQQVIRNEYQYKAATSYSTDAGGSSYSEPTIPPYEEKVGESIQVKKARLLYQSRKRGMLENGLLLSGFAGKYLPTMDEPQLSLYDRLINLPSNDWDIYYWATGTKETPPEFDNEVMKALKNFTRNEDRADRTRQPELY
ncbi:Succinate dehydrogenase assembly factor 2 mitochondrial [Trinorchestia longiramus]|nr:Succinate dehydrogenase assembly factor 2 mitochondrial [Trinorchestia longiramus]